MCEDIKKLDLTLLLMKSLNFIIILFITAIISYSLAGFIHENSGTNFLSKIDSLPIAPWKLPIITLCLYGSCLCLMNIKNVNSVQLGIKITIELVLTFFICYLINFSYIGLFLLLIADLMIYLPTTKWKISLLITVCLVYLLTEYLIINVSLNLISFDLYLDYFQREARLIIVGIKDLLTSINLLMFLFYIGFSVKIQHNENERILSLNKQLNLANIELQNANTQLEEYSDELVRMTETEERNRLAREIHDTLGHSLTGIITGIEACIALIDVAPEATKIQLKSIAEVATQGMTDVRRSVKALRPDRLERFDLERALVQTIEEMSLATNAKIEYDFRTDLNHFSNDEEDIIYRIVQESITNSIRHGRATRINIEIKRDKDVLMLCVQDNGIGCKVVHKGFGLHHMQERLKMLNGELEYSGNDGFILKAKIPIRSSEKD